MMGCERVFDFPPKPTHTCKMAYTVQQATKSGREFGFDILADAKARDEPA